MTVGARTGLFGVYCLGLILANLHALRGLVELARSDSSASHVLVIPFVTLGLIVLNRKAIFSSVRFAWCPAFAVILAALGSWPAAALYRRSGWHEDALTWHLATIVILCAGGFLLFYGREAFRTALFPFLFLGFMIPIPGVLLDGMVRILVIGSSETVASLFTLTGTPYHREGMVFFLPNLVIEVADECSGIRSSIALSLTTLIASYMYLRNGLSKAFLVAAILPIMILKNGIRIVSLSLLAMYVDPGYLGGRLHQDGGIVFLLLALAIAAPVFVVLQRWEMNSGHNHVSRAVATPQPRQAYWRNTHG